MPDLRIHYLSDVENSPQERHIARRYSLIEPHSDHCISPVLPDIYIFNKSTSNLFETGHDKAECALYVPSLRLVNLLC